MIDYVVNGAVGVSMRNLRNGQNYFPYIAELKDRVIKYIDIFCAMDSTAYDVDGESMDANPYSSTLSLRKKDTVNLVVDNVSCVEYCPMLQNGKRKFVGYKIDLEKSYISTASDDAGANMFVVFYYEDEKPNAVTNPKNFKISTSGVNLGVGTTNFFEDNRTLADKRFTQIYPSFSTFTQKGEQAILSPNEWGSMFVNLVKDNNIFVKNVPLSLLMTGSSFWYGHIVFDGVQIDFTRSYLQACASKQANFKGYPVVLGFKYVD